MGRSILAVITGLLVAFVSIVVLELLGHAIVPVPAAPRAGDVEEARAYFASLPSFTYVFVLVAYLVASFAGAWVAKVIARRPRFGGGWAIAAVLLAATIANLVAMPHPLWFAAASLAAIVVGTAAALWSPMARSLAPSEHP